MWLVLAVSGHILNAFVFLADKALVGKLYPYPRSLAFPAGISGIFLFPLFFWFLLPAPPGVLMAAVLGGVLTIPALLYFFAALRREEVSRVIPVVGSLVPIFTLGLSYILLGESLHGPLLAAFIFLVLGGILIEFRSFKDIFSKKVYSLFSLEVVAAFLFAAGFVLQKFAFEGTNDFSAFLWARIGGVAASLPLLADKQVRARLRFSELKEVGIKTGGLYIGTRVLAGISPLIILAAISLGSVSLVNALQGVQFVLLFILAVLFSRRWPHIFREEINLAVLTQKSFATALIVIGLVLLL